MEDRLCRICQFPSTLFFRDTRTFLKCPNCIKFLVVNFSPTLVHLLNFKAGLYSFSPVSLLKPTQSLFCLPNASLSTYLSIFFPPSHEVIRLSMQKIEGLLTAFAVKVFFFRELFLF